MRFHFWYVLIHIGLGLIGYEYFTFTNSGGFFAFCASVLVQAYAVFEIHREAQPRFEASLGTAESMMGREKMKQDYRKRLIRVWFTRSCIYALLTLFAAMAVQRGTG